MAVDPTTDRRTADPDPTTDRRTADEVPRRPRPRPAGPVAVDPALQRRAGVHAALGEPVRLAIVEELLASDRAPSALAARFGLAGNLLAHHLDVLERVGLVERHVSAGDRRRRYVRLRRHALAGLARSAESAAGAPGGARRPGGRALFVCTQNSARSQLAAALWRRRIGGAAASAGTHPAERVHPGAVAAAHRAGLDLAGARPRGLQSGAERIDAEVVVTVCDRAHEELDPPQSWLHWSVPDPVEAGTPEAFDTTLAALDERITAIARPGTPEPT